MIDLGSSNSSNLANCTWLTTANWDPNMLLPALPLLSYHCSFARAGPAGKTKGGAFQWSSSLVQLAAQTLAIIQEMQQEDMERGNEVTFQQQPGWVPG